MDEIKSKIEDRSSQCEYFNKLYEYNLDFIKNNDFKIEIIKKNIGNARNKLFSNASNKVYELKYIELIKLMLNTEKIYEKNYGNIKYEYDELKYLKNFFKNNNDFKKIIFDLCNIDNKKAILQNYINLLEKKYKINNCSSLNVDTSVIRQRNEIKKSIECCNLELKNMNELICQHIYSINGIYVGKYIRTSAFFKLMYCVIIHINKNINHPNIGAFNKLKNDDLFDQIINNIYSKLNNELLADQ